MSHYSALFSIVFMMSFVALFDCMHVDRYNARFCNDGLLSQEDIQRLRNILLASQE
ncbi:MAG: hypothetical protein ACLQU1_02330 [Bryobacteraceae bacterium]